MWDSPTRGTQTAPANEFSRRERQNGRSPSASGLAKSQGTADLSLLVQFHDLDGASSFRLKMNEEAVHSLVDAEQFELDVTGKGCQCLSEILPQILFSPDGPGSFAQKVHH